MLPAAQKSDRRTFSTISGNSWDLPIHLLRGFGIFSNEFFLGISSSNFGLTRLVALYFYLAGIFCARTICAMFSVAAVNCEAAKHFSMMLVVGKYELGRNRTRSMVWVMFE